MPANDVYLGNLGTEILLPATGRTLSKAWVELSREDRTASGRLVRDVRARKQSWSFTYSMIAHDDLEDIATLYQIDSTLSLLIRLPDTTLDSYTVHLRPFDAERVTAVGDNLWGNVQIDVEQE